MNVNEWSQYVVTTGCVVDCSLTPCQVSALDGHLVSVNRGRYALQIRGLRSDRRHLKPFKVALVPPIFQDVAVLLHTTSIDSVAHHLRSLFFRQLVRQTLKIVITVRELISTPGR
jgi:hypothetical protein